MSGQFTIMLVDAGTEAERVVVTEADEYVYCSDELLVEWRAGRMRHCHFANDRLTVGTAGEGLGVVVYEVISEGRNEDRVTDFAFDRIELPRVILKRLPAPATEEEKP